MFLIVSVPALWLAYNAWRGLPVRGGAIWLLALVTGELAPWAFALRAGVAGLAVWLGFAGGWAGRTALVLIAISLILLVIVQMRALRARRVLETSLAGLIGSGVRLPRLPVWRLLRPVPAPHSSVEVVRDLEYGPHPMQRADRYRRRDLEGSAPVMVQVHGGGWTGGRRGRQGAPLMHRMAELGWVVFDAGYRLSPKATYPDQLIDVKAAIAWIRETSEVHGADPSFIVLTGGSAGGQLVAMAALTAGDRALQPGFEESETSVAGCVPLYGVHDMLDRSGTRPKWPYLASHIVKAEPSAAPDLWKLTSPIKSATADRPPFFIVHGALDSLVRPSESRRLRDALVAVGGPPVGHAELPGATHGFDALNSVRGLRFAQAASVVLEHWHAAASGGGHHIADDGHEVGSPG